MTSAVKRHALGGTHRVWHMIYEELAHRNWGLYIVCDKPQ